MSVRIEHATQSKSVSNCYPLNLPIGIQISILLLAFLGTLVSWRELKAAEPQFSPVPFGALADGTIGVATGDVDNDGDLDIVTANSGCQEGVCTLSSYSYIYLNDGNGNFFAGQLNQCLNLPATVRCVGRQPKRSVDVALVDLNNDGYLDIVLANFLDANQVYLNDGAGNFSEHQMHNLGPIAGYTRGLAIGDVDGDGDFDIVTANEEFSQNVIYLNDGAGRFDWPDSARNFGEGNDFTWSVALGDVNNDGSLDIVAGNRGQNVVYLNDGIGHYHQGPVNCATPPSTVRCFGWGDDPTHYVTLSDLNSDNYLDIIVGNYGDYNAIYLNNYLSKGPGEFYNGPVNCEAPPQYYVYCFDNPDSTTASLALSDLNHDGHMDIVSANVSTDSSQPIYSRIFLLRTSLNDIFIYSVRTLGQKGNHNWDVALADLGNTGSLDIITGNALEINEVFRHNGSGQPQAPIEVPNSAGATTSVILADLDKNGTLNRLATGGREYPLLAIGDINQDGNLDLVQTFSTTLPHRIFLNDGTGVFDGSLACDAIEKIRCFGASVDNGTRSVTVGDLDNDGDLDIVTGNYEKPNVIYFNDGSGNFYQGEINCAQSTVNYACFGRGSAQTTSIAIGDISGDGNLDIVIGNYFEPNQVFINNGNGDFTEARNFGTMADRTLSIALGDINNDGWLDIVTGQDYEQNVVYFNNKFGSFYTGSINCLTPDHSYVCFGQANREPRDVKVHDMNGDGYLDVVVGNYNAVSEAFINDGTGSFKGLLHIGLSARNTRSLAIGDINNDGFPDVYVGNTNQLDEIFISSGRSASINSSLLSLIQIARPIPTANAGYYSTPFIVEDASVPIRLSIEPKAWRPGYLRSYFSPDGGGRWLPALNQDGNNFMSLSGTDSMTVVTYQWDIVASGLFGKSDNVVFRFEVYPSVRPQANGLPGQYQWSNVSVLSFPFRVRGNQVRVIGETSKPISDSFVYRIPANKPDQSEIISNGIEKFRTSLRGYLQGRGELKPGDRLFALQPISVTESYTLYQTSATPNPLGLNDFTITSGGVQTLTVSTANPLLLFDLTVSLEWQEGTDTPFLNNLRRDLIESSKALYDWTNGQVALGKVTVYQGREHWDDAHIQMLASNQVRPSANRGGIVTDTTVLTHTLLTEPITATRGIVRIGPTWTRYGDSDPNYVYDWQRVLAHELGHYLLFLEDTYLGLDEASGLLVPVDTCGNSAMSDPYEATGTEFRYNDERWQAECGHTLAELPDWDLIRLAYPALHAPPPTNPGPGTMPFLFTTVEIKPPPVGASPLTNPLLSLGNASSTLLNGRVYLRRPNQQLLDLGKYLGNELLVRGGQEGDELCIFAATAYACSYLSNSQPARFITNTLWTPMIAVTPTSTTTLTIFVDQTAGAQVSATIYPDGATPQTVALLPGAPQSITLNHPAVEALVEITGTVEGQRFITGYAIGSGPGRLRSFDGPGRLRSFDGPISSGDGGVVLYPPLALDKDTFISLQLATILPPLPIGVTPIGRSYYVRPSGEIADYAGGSIAFQYLGRDVTQQYIPEENLAVYYWTGSIWRRLPTIRNTTQNIASAPLQGSGLYLLSGFQTSLNGPGWNLVGYPLPYSLPITQALSPLEGFYRMVYDYDATNPVDPWRIFSVGIPDWVNDLRELKPNRGYWIYATENISWTVPTQAIASGANANQFLYPPAVYYGWITPTVDFAPTVGMQVRAEIDGMLCGTSTVQSLDGKLIYVIKVAANDGLANPPACGAIGKTIVFKVDNWQMAHDIPWDNTRISSHALTQIAGFSTPVVTATPSAAPTLANTPIPVVSPTATPVTIQTPTPEATIVVGQDSVQVYLPLVSR